MFHKNEYTHSSFNHLIIISKVKMSKHVNTVIIQVRPHAGLVTMPNNTDSPDNSQHNVQNALLKLLECVLVQNQ